MRQIEDILKSTLELIQIMAYSSVDEIIQFAIDEGSRLTGSKIGYFHFVNPDQKTIDLKTWSIETLKTCNADEKTSHYPIDEAGVWVDCIYQKKAVIHNDYVSLPHKKGLPERHVPLKRDMAVPVIEDGKIVAIVGVGNKGEEYNQFDIDRLTLLAENTWIIVQRKRAEESLQKSEERFRLLYEKAPLGYQSLDEKGHFIEVNETWLSTLGYTRDEVVGKSFGNFLHPDWTDHFKLYFPRFKAVGEVLGAEFEMVKKDGARILVSFNGKIAYDEKGDFKQTHCILHDITDRKRAEEENLNREKLQAVLATAGTACHELNQPLQTISGYSELLLMAVSEEHPLYEKIRKIGEQIERMKKITTKLMGVTRYETKLYSGNTKIIDLDNIKERRKHKRFIPCDRASVIGECGSFKECQIIDISMGGLAIWCKETQNRSEDFSELSIKTKNINSNLDKIPCNVIENLKTNKISHSDNEKIERYSLQFGKLTQKQTDHLEYFIQNHTSALFFSQYSSNLLVDNSSLLL